MRVKRTSKARIEPEMRNMAIERYAKDASTDLPAGPPEPGFTARAGRLQTSDVRRLMFAPQRDEANRKYMFRCDLAFFVFFHQD